MQNFKNTMVIFTLGVMLGGLLGISIKYPVPAATLEIVHSVCKQQTFTSFKIGISGKVFEVTCPDGQTYYLK